MNTTKPERIKAATASGRPPCRPFLTQPRSPATNRSARQPTKPTLPDHHPRHRHRLSDEVETYATEATGADGDHRNDQGPKDRRHVLLRFRHIRQRIAHPMHPAALPGRAEHAP